MKGVFELPLGLSLLEVHQLHGKLLKSRVTVKAAVYALFQRMKVLVTRAHRIQNARPLVSIETASEVSEER